MVKMEWLMDNAINAHAGLSLAKMTTTPKEITEAHSHPNCSETLHVLSGTIEQRLGDEWHTLHEGDTLLIPRGTIHQTRTISDTDAVMMIAYSNGIRIYQPER